jgi:hypothetical protein
VSTTDARAAADCLRHLLGIVRQPTGDSQLNAALRAMRPVLLAVLAMHSVQLNLRLPALPQLWSNVPTTPSPAHCLHWEQRAPGVATALRSTADRRGIAHTMCAWCAVLLQDPTPRVYNERSVKIIGGGDGLPHTTGARLRELYRPTANQFMLYQRNVRRASARKTRVIRRLQRLLRQRNAAHIAQGARLCSPSGGWQRHWLRPS